MIKKILKILLYILSGIIGLVLLLLLLLHKGSFNGYLTRQLTTQANSALSGEIHMQPFSGSLFKAITLHDVEIINADTTVIAANRIKVSYSLPALLRKQLLVHSLTFDTLEIRTTQRSDSTWTILSAFNPATPRSPDKDTTKESFFKTIEVSAFEIGTLRTQAAALYGREYIPQTLEASLALAFNLSGDRIVVGLERFSLRAGKPDLQVKEFAGSFILQDNMLQWDSLRLALTETVLASAGSLPLNDPIAASLQMQFSPLAFKDFRPFMQGDTLYGSPDIDLRYGGEGERRMVVADIASAGQRIAIDGWFEGLEEQDSYSLQLIVREFDGSVWTGDPALKTLVTGTMEIEGTGYDIKTNRIAVNGLYDTIMYGDYAADSLKLKASKLGDRVDGSLQAATNRGGIDAGFRLSRIFGTPAYVLNTTLKDIDVADFVPESGYYSDLNMDLKASGSGFDLKTLQTSFLIHARNSQFIGQPVENFEIALNMDHGAYDIEGMDLLTPFFRLFADGKGDIERENNISFRLEPYNLNPLLAPYDLPLVQLNGSIDGRFTGIPDSLRLDATFAFDSVRYDSITLADIQSNLDINLLDSIYNGHLTLNTGHLVAGSIAADSVSLASDFTNTRLDNSLFLQLNDTVRANLQFLVETGVVPVIYLPMAEIDFNNEIWTGGSDTTYFALGKDTIRIRKFEMKKGAQMITADGHFAFRGNEDLRLTLQQIDLEELSRIAPLPGGLKGLLDAEVSLTGDAAQPLLAGTMQVSDPTWQETDFSHFHFQFDYRDELMRIEGNLDNRQQQRLYADIALPMHLSLEDSIYLLDQRDNFAATLRIDSLNTALFNPYFQSAGLETKGYFSTRAQVTNTLHEPEIEGGIFLHEGSVMYPDAGIGYHDIVLESNFSGDRISLGRLEVHSGDGMMEVTGYADISLLGDRGLKNIDMKIMASDFKALDSEQGTAVINSNLLLSGPYDGAKINGQLTVLESTIHSDAILAGQQVKTTNPNPPLLVQALQDTIPDDTLTIAAASATGDPPGNIFYNNLAGEFTVRVPGNTWVKGKDMNFELRGALRAVKEGPQIDLFGDLNVNRGYYTFYGRRFRFNKGKVTFTGGTEVNPQVDFEVVYAFRDEERELRNLKLFLTGRALNPDIRFTLDDAFVEEKDAIAYILFGRRTDNLTTQQTASVEQSAINMTRDLALGQISNVLKDALQSTLQLDVVEINGGESLQSGSVTIGKYITNDLYVKYEQNFAFDKKEKVIEPEEIALEYQIIRSLFLQATNQRENSGFDLIFKKEWK